MNWFRQRSSCFVRLTLAVWVLVLLVATLQGCLVQPLHELSAVHDTPLAAQHADEHRAHASGCLQHCADAAVALSPAWQLPTLDIFSWAFLLLLPVLALLAPANIATVAFLALRRHVPPRPPARLLFVRFND